MACMCPHCGYRMIIVMDEVLGEIYACINGCPDIEKDYGGKRAA